MTPTFDLAGHRVLVTGAASGIGLATARAFAVNGALVALNDLPGPKLDDAVAALVADGHAVCAAPGDVGDSGIAHTMVASAIADLGGLDTLVNNAGTPATHLPIAPADFDRQDEAFWAKLLNVNLLGPYRCTRAAADALRASGGAIVNTASVSAFGGGASSSPYAATKAALVSMTREWARALAPEVRVNAIAPGLVDSDWMCRFEGTDLDVTSSVPLGRQGQPAEYAQVILFLAVAATYMTGQTVIVDGGVMA